MFRRKEKETFLLLKGKKQALLILLSTNQIGTQMQMKLEECVKEVQINEIKIKSASAQETIRKDIQNLIGEGKIKKFRITKSGGYKYLGILDGKLSEIQEELVD